MTAALLTLSLLLTAICSMRSALAQGMPPATTSLGSLISWQQHGHDDIRQWRADLTKGSWDFKIDFNYQPEEYCSKLPNVPQPADPRGCFLMIHTPTVFAVGQDGPSSSSDILAFLADTRHRSLLTRPERRIYYALRFYSFPPTMCDGSDNSENWLQLTDEFYNASNALIAALDLNVEFYYDQIPYGLACVATRWPSWVSTWDQPTYDNRIYDNAITVTASGSIYNDARVQVFNRGEDLPQLRDMAAHSWYKFQNSSYPMVVYEPSDQDAINIIVDIFLSSKFNYTPGYIMAFNNDPVMYALYTSSRSQKAIHQQISNDLAFNINTTVSLRNLALAYSWPQVTTLDIAGDGSQFIVITVYRDAAQVPKYITQSGTAPMPDAFTNAPPPALVFTNYTTLMATQLNISSAQRMSSISSFMALYNGANTSFVVVGTDAAEYFVYMLDTVAGTLTLFNSGTLPQPPQAVFAANALAVVPGVKANASVVGLVQASAGATQAMGSSCTVWLQMWTLDMSAPGQKPILSGSSICASMWSGGMKVKEIVASAGHVSVAATKALSNSRCSYSPVMAGAVPALEVFVAYGTRFQVNQVGQNSRVYLAQVCIDLRYGGASNSVVPPPSLNPPAFTVGDFPSLAVTTDTASNTTMVMVVATNGMCPNSFLKDDSPLGVPAMCDAYERGYGSPIIGVLTYAYANSKEFVRKLAADPQPSAVPIGSIMTNVCDPFLLTGNYDQGYQPSASLIKTPIGFVANAVHVGLQGLAQNDCGSPSPVDGLMLDAWALPQPTPYEWAPAYMSVAATVAQGYQKEEL